MPMAQVALLVVIVPVCCEWQLTVRPTHEHAQQALSAGPVVLDQPCQGHMKQTCFVGVLLVALCLSLQPGVKTRGLTPYSAQMGHPATSQPLWGFVVVHCLGPSSSQSSNPCQRLSSSIAGFCATINASKIQEPREPLSSEQGVMHHRVDQIHAGYIKGHNFKYLAKRCQGIQRHLVEPLDAGKKTLCQSNVP